MGGKKAKCGACRNYFIFPSTEKLAASTTPLLTPEPINGVGPFLDEVLLEPPPLPRRSRFPRLQLPHFQLPRLRSTRWYRLRLPRTEPLFKPTVLHENLMACSRYLGGYLPKFLLMILIIIGIVYLLALPSDPKSPYFFTSAAILGGVIVCFGFLDDFEGFSNILSIVATILTWATAMATAVIPCVMIFLIFIASQDKGMQLAPHEIGTSFLIVTALFFLAIAFTGGFMQYGFFRPAAVMFIIFCILAPQAQSFYHSPFTIYKKLYAQGQEEVCQNTTEPYRSAEEELFGNRDKPAVPTRPTIDQLAEQLFNNNRSIQQEALIELSRIAPVNKKRELVCRGLISALQTEPENKFWENKTTQLFNAWMTPAVNTALIRLVNDSVANQEYWRVNLLAKVNSPPLAALIVNHWQSSPLPLNDAMYNLGDRAEEPLWQYLSTEDRNILAKTCVMLVKVGTKRSVPKLLELLNNPDQFVSRIAKTSIKDLEEKTR